MDPTLNSNSPPNFDFAHPSSLVQLDISPNGVTLMKINRPLKRNALSQELIDTLVAAIHYTEKDERVKVVVLTGSKAEAPFSAGADLAEMQHLTTAQAHKTSYLKDLSDAFTTTRKPIISCVSGFALGGGFELALMTDIIYSTPTTRFALPELSVGTIPGAGGTQRLTRILGKYKAMELILTSATITGKELEGFGVVAKTWEEGELLERVLEVAGKIAEKSAPIVGLAREAILAAEQTHLDSGLQLERSLYYASFSLEDRTEGMQAFIGKRKPIFKDK